MRIRELKMAARTALRGQWGVVALMLIVSGILSNLVIRATSSLESINGLFGSLGLVFGRFLLAFAFYYGFRYALLFIIRGGRANLAMLFVVLNKKRYVPTVLLNIVISILTTLVSFIGALPLIIISLIQGGMVVQFFFKAYSALSAMSAETSPEALATYLNGIFPLSYLYGILWTALLVLVLNFLMSIYTFVLINVQLDRTTASLKEVFSITNQLLHGNWMRFILTNLAFVGWYILSMLLLFIPVFWILPYQLTTCNKLYDAILAEKQI